MSGKRKYKPAPESVEHRAQRLARQQMERLERSHYGLDRETLLAAHALPGDTLDLMHTIAERDGIRIGEPGGEIAKLVGYGFVEISAANGHDSIAKVTPAGLKVLLVRLAKRA
jgi:hypothetical protein